MATVKESKTLGAQTIELFCYLCGCLQAFTKDAKAGYYRCPCKWNVMPITLVDRAIIDEQRKTG